MIWVVFAGLQQRSETVSNVDPVREALCNIGHQIVMCPEKIFWLLGGFCIANIAIAQEAQNGQYQEIILLLFPVVNFPQPLHPESFVPVVGDID